MPENDTPLHPAAFLTRCADLPGMGTSFSLVIAKYPFGERPNRVSLVCIDRRHVEAPQGPDYRQALRQGGRP